MFDASNQAAVFLPMLLVVAITFAAFVKMGAARGKAVKEMPPEFYRAHQGGQEPEFAVAAVRHYGNTLELPTLFYAACLTAFVLQLVGSWTLIFAWAYAVMRLGQSIVHMTYNNPMHRGLFFVVSVIALFAMWVNIALGIL